MPPEPTLNAVFARYGLKTRVRLSDCPATFRTKPSAPAALLPPPPHAAVTPATRHPAARTATARNRLIAILVHSCLVTCGRFVVEPALRPMTVGQVESWRCLGRAPFHREWAPWVKPAAGRRVDQARRLADIPDPLDIRRPVRVRRGGDQQLGIRMRRPLRYHLRGT